MTEPVSAVLVAIAKIVKIVRVAVRVFQALKTLHSFHSSLHQKRYTQNLVLSFIVKGIISALSEIGIPLDTTIGMLDLGEQLEGWATKTLEIAASDLAHPIFDPREVQNALISQGERLLRGQAVGNGLSPVRNATRVADPIILHRGEFEREVTDLQVGGAGMDFELRRTYRSSTAYLGPLGPGWDHSYNLRMGQENDTIVVRLTGQLCEHRFVRHPRFGDAEFTYYVPPNGVHDVLVPDGGTSFLLKRPGGVIHQYEESVVHPREHRIRRIEDRFGNYLDFRYTPEERLDRVFVNSDHRRVKFHYDEIGRLAYIKDHAQRTVVYAYDDWGYLCCVAGPALSGEKPSRLERYEYDQVGAVRKLVQVLDWKSRILVENEYDRNTLSEHLGKVIRQTENRGESTFLYETIHGESDLAMPIHDIPTLRVWESRRNGHQIEHVFNDFGNELLTRERFAEGCQIREAVRRYRYNADGQVIAALDPNGILTQYLFGRDHIADAISWPDIDPVVGDVPLKDRMSFGNLLAAVTRGRRVAHSGAAVDPSFWKQRTPSVKMVDHADDTVTKFHYDRDSQLLVSRSDPRHTVSADPLHVESASPGDPSYNTNDAQYVAHQRHLTKFGYGTGPKFELQQTVSPDRSRPSSLDGVAEVTDIIDKVIRYDSKGRPLERLDARGYQWFDEYYDAASGPKEGFLQRRLVPHLDLVLSQDTPEILEIEKSGTWQATDRYLLSSGTSDEQIKVTVEGVRIVLYQSSDATSMLEQDPRSEVQIGSLRIALYQPTLPEAIISDNTHVRVCVDGIQLPDWDQTMHAAYVINDLPVGSHIVEVRDTLGIPISTGRVRSHVSLQYEVNPLGQVLEETDARGNIAVNVVDVLGRKTQVTAGPAMIPSVVHYEYDLTGLLILEREEWRDESGTMRPEGAIVRRHNYDKAGLLISESEEAEQEGTRRVVRHRYDVEDNLRETVNARGIHTYFSYDALNRQVRTVRAACSPDLSITTTKYDLSDHVLSQRNPRGALHVNGYRTPSGAWQSSIDTRGRATVRTDPLGHMVITDYDALDNPTVVRQFQCRTDGQFEMLSRRVTEYDEHGDIIRVTDGVFDTPILTADPVHHADAEFSTAVSVGNVQSASTEYHLDSRSNRVAVRNPDGGIQRQRFDGQGRVYDEVDAEGRHKYRIYDGNGNVIRIYAFEPVRDPQTTNILYREVFVQDHEYDELNQELARVDPYGNRWEQKYDTLGNLTCTTDPLGNVVRFKHNAFGEVILKTQERTQTGLGGGTPLPALRTQREYDENGNLLAIIDPLQRRTDFTFDVLDRLATTRFAVGANEPTELRAYDAADNLVSITDRNGLVKTMQYDLLNRHSRTDIDASDVAPENALSPHSATFALFTYDALGNPTRHENDYCTVKIQRDSRGLPIREEVEIKNLTGMPGPQTILRGFDLASRREKLAYPSNREVKFTYDHLGRVTSIQNVASPPDYPGRGVNATGFDLARYTYVGRRLVGIEYGNGLTLAVRFDGRGRVLERIVTDRSSDTVWRMQRLADAAGFTRIEGTTTRNGDRSRKFSLDSVYRLTHYQDSPVNWIDPLLLAPPRAPVNPRTNNAQALINAVMDPLDMPATPAVYEYDEMGNRLNTREPGLPPLRSVPNRLNQYTAVDDIPWQYDANGNLRDDGERALAYDLDNALQEVIDPNSGDNITYFRDALGRVIAERTANSTTLRLNDGSLPLVEITTDGRTEYTPHHLDESVIHAAKDGEDYWITRDGLGSLRLLTNADGDENSIPAFLPFGLPENRELDLSPLPLGFAGMWYTPGLPFYHSRLRTYRPDVGRHLQRDPVGFIDTLNLYLYVRNNPVNYADPVGLMLSDETKSILNWVQKLANIEELTSDWADELASVRGRRAHAVLEAGVTFGWEVAPEVNIQRVAAEVHVDEKGVIRFVGRDPGAAEKGWRTIDIAVLKKGTVHVHGGQVGSSLIGHRAAEVVEVALDYKTGHAELKRVKHMQDLLGGGVPYVKVVKGDIGDLVQSVGRKSTRLLLRRLGKKAIQFASKYTAKAIPIVGGLFTYSMAEGSERERITRAVAGEIPVGPLVDAEMAYDIWMEYNRLSMESDLVLEKVTPY